MTTAATARRAHGRRSRGRALWWGALSSVPLWMAIAAAPAGAGEPPRDAKEQDLRREQSSLRVTDADPAAAAAADAEDEKEAADEEAGDAPAQVEVKPGDTIWDLCDRYFHDPWRWPKVWAQNPDITNPHWIFPGQMINLGGMTRSAPAAAAPQGQGSTAGRDTGVRAVTRATPPAVTAGLLREVGFVDAQELPFAGTIDGSREEKIMLATGDQAYVAFPRDRPLQPGQRLTIYQVDTDNPVREPHSSKVLGYLVHIYGDLSIDGVNADRDGVNADRDRRGVNADRDRRGVNADRDRRGVNADRPVASATLLDLVAPVERGYRVGPLFRQFKRVRPRPGAADATAQVIAAVQPNILIAEGMFVVLDRGARHGVEVGNRFTVVRHGDGNRGVMEDAEASTDPSFPPDRIADVLAVDVREETAIGWVVGGSRSIRLGDRAELKKGR
jgi:hypothetical protein